MYYNIKRLISKAKKKIPRLAQGSIVAEIPESRWKAFEEFSKNYRQELKEQKLGLVEVLPKELQGEEPKEVVDHVGKTKRWAPTKGHKERVGYRLTKQLVSEMEAIEALSDDQQDKAYNNLITKIWQKQQSRMGQKSKIG